MFFKKQYISRPKKTHKFFGIYLSALLGGLCIFFLGFLSIKSIESIEFHALETLSEEIDEIPSIPMQGSQQLETPDVTYILIVGRGGGDHDAPDLTDTIMLAGINHKKETLSFLSIPRDLWVTYPEGGEGKINRIYETYALKNTLLAIDHLKNKVSQITGKEIHYYVSVDFEGFIKMINILGGVEITLEKNFVDYQYPDGKLGYKTFILRKGTWTLDGEVALMYARSRHSSSDFDRSLRQQEIISSLKNKITELGYMSDAGKIVNLYHTFTKYVATDMSLKNIISLGLKIKSWGNPKTLSFNINDTCYQGNEMCAMGGFLYVPLREYFGGASVLLPNTADPTYPEIYDDIQTYADYIFRFPEIFFSQKDIHIYNASGVSGFAGRLGQTLQTYGFPIDRYTSLHTLRNWVGDENIIYINNDLAHKEAYAYVLQNITGITPEFTSLMTQSHDADIEIILMNTNSLIQ